MIHEFTEGHVKVETHKGVTSIEFFHPKGNSLPRRILEDLAQEVHAAAGDKETHVIVLKSAGDSVFCSGASFDELLAVRSEAEATEFFTGFANLINEMRKCPKFIIVRVQGKCIGGAMGLAASADYCIAFEKAEIKLSELSIGIGPFVVGPAVERKIGLSAFSQLAIDSTMFRNADWAKRKGLFAEVHESIENMDESISRLASTLAHSSREAMQEMKKIFWKGTEHWDILLKERAAISGRLILTESARTALQSRLATAASK
jgi:methylglutaconyl-CoA hydratase